MLDDHVRAVIDEMLAIRDDAITRDFVTDVYAYSTDRRLQMACLYRDAVRAHEERKRVIDSGGVPLNPSGAVLGTKPPPKRGEYYALTSTGHIHEADAKKLSVADVTHWCSDSSGWWRVPPTEG